MNKQQSGKKFDQGKPPVFRGVIAYFPRALMEIAKVSEYGAQKYECDYEDSTWDKVENPNRYLDAMMRHTAKRITEGEVNHEDGNLLHRAQTAWNALADLERFLRDRDEKEEDKPYTFMGEPVSFKEYRDLAREYELRMSDMFKVEEPKKEPWKWYDNPGEGPDESKTNPWKGITWNIGEKKQPVTPKGNPVTP